MLLRYQIVLLLLSSLFSIPIDLEDDDIAVIVSSEIQQAEISKEDLINIYTLRKQNWDDGARIYISDYKGNSEIRNRFYDYLGTSVNNIKKIWLRAQFTGKISPPRILGDSSDILDEVINSPGTIGFVPSSMVTEDVTIILLIPND